MGFTKAPMKRTKGRGGRWAHLRGPGRLPGAGALGIMSPGTPSTTFSEESSLLGQEQSVDWTYDSGEVSVPATTCPLIPSSMFRMLGNHGNPYSMHTHHLALDQAQALSHPFG